jgi:hypothetical protein
MVSGDRGSALDGAAEAGAVEEEPLEDQEQADGDERGDRQGREEHVELHELLEDRQAHRERLELGSGSTSIGQRKSFQEAMTAKTETTPMIGRDMGSTIDQNRR